MSKDVAAQADDSKQADSKLEVAPKLSSSTETTVWETIIRQAITFLGAHIAEAFKAKDSDDARLDDMSRLLASANSMMRFDIFHAWFACTPIFAGLDELHKRNKGDCHREWLAQLEFESNELDICIREDQPQRYRFHHFYYVVMDIIHAYPQELSLEMDEANEKMRTSIKRVLMQIVSFDPICISNPVVFRRLISQLSTAWVGDLARVLIARLDSVVTIGGHFGEIAVKHQKVPRDYLSETSPFPLEASNGASKEAANLPFGEERLSIRAQSF